MRPIINDPQLISACGLYCGACRKFLNDKCPGCNTASHTPTHSQPAPKYCYRCKIRQCCRLKGYETCAECDVDVKQCKTYNTFIGKLFSLVFKTDRAESIRYIREHGKDAYAERMAWDETMAIKRKYCVLIGST